MKVVDRRRRASISATAAASPARSSWRCSTPRRPTASPTPRSSTSTTARSRSGTRHPGGQQLFVRDRRRRASARRPTARSRSRRARSSSARRTSGTGTAPPRGHDATLLAVTWGTTAVGGPTAAASRWSPPSSTSRSSASGPTGATLANLCGRLRVCAPSSTSVRPSRTPTRALPPRRGDRARLPGCWASSAELAALLTRVGRDGVRRRPARRALSRSRASSGRRCSAGTRTTCSSSRSSTRCCGAASIGSPTVDVRLGADAPAASHDLLRPARCGRRLRRRGRATCAASSASPQLDLGYDEQWLVVDVMLAPARRALADDHPAGVRPGPARHVRARRTAASAVGVPRCGTTRASWPARTCGRCSRRGASAPTTPSWYARCRTASTRVVAERWRADRRSVPRRRRRPPDAAVHGPGHVLRASAMRRTWRGSSPRRRGEAGDALLDTYERERRPHVEAVTRAVDRGRPPARPARGRLGRRPPAAPAGAVRARPRPLVTAPGPRPRRPFPDRPPGAPTGVQRKASRRAARRTAGRSWPDIEVPTPAGVRVGAVPRGDLRVRVRVGPARPLHRASPAPGIRPRCRSRTDQRSYRADHRTGTRLRPLMKLERTRSTSPRSSACPSRGSELLEEDAHLEPGQPLAEAQVGSAAAERDVTVRGPARRRTAEVGELGLVVVGGQVPGDDLVAGGDRDTAHLGVDGGRPAEVDLGAGPAQHLLHRRGRAAPARPQASQLVRVLEQGDQTVAERMTGGLVAGDEQEQEERLLLDARSGAHRRPRRQRGSRSRRRSDGGAGRRPADRSRRTPPG